MSISQLKNYRVLAVAPSTRGFGFAVLEGRDQLVDWGVKSVNTDIASILKGMMEKNRVTAVVLEIKPRSQSARLRLLMKRIMATAERSKVKVLLLSRKRVRTTFFPEGLGTKHLVAERIAEQFPEELGFRLPPKRAFWKGEDHRMAIFEAVALAVAAQKTSAG